MAVFEEEGRRQRAGESHLDLNDAVELGTRVAASFVATTPGVEPAVLRALFLKLAEEAIDGCLDATARIRSRS